MAGTAGSCSAGLLLARGGGYVTGGRAVDPWTDRVSTLKPA